MVCSTALPIASHTDHAPHVLMGLNRKTPRRGIISCQSPGRRTPRWSLPLFSPVSKKVLSGRLAVSSARAFSRVPVPALEPRVPRVRHVVSGAPSTVLSSARSATRQRSRSSWRNGSTPRMVGPKRLEPDHRHTFGSVNRTGSRARARVPAPSQKPAQRRRFSAQRGAERP